MSYILQHILNTSSVEDQQRFDADIDWHFPCCCGPIKKRYGPCQNSEFVRLWSPGIDSARLLKRSTNKGSGYPTVLLRCGGVRGLVAFPGA
jgi:hypothetical protein